MRTSDKGFRWEKFYSTPSCEHELLKTDLQTSFNSIDFSADTRLVWNTNYLHISLDLTTQEKEIGWEIEHLGMFEIVQYWFKGKVDNDRCERGLEVVDEVENWIEEDSR